MPPAGPLASAGGALELTQKHAAKKREIGRSEGCFRHRSAAGSIQEPPQVGGSTCYITGKPGSERRDQTHRLLLKPEAVYDAGRDNHDARTAEGNSVIVEPHFRAAGLDKQDLM